MTAESPAFTSAKAYDAKARGRSGNPRKAGATGGMIRLVGLPLLAAAMGALLRLDGVGVALNLGLFLLFEAAARLMKAGLVFERNYRRRENAQGARTPRKLLAAIVAGVATAATASLSAGAGMISALLLGAVAGLACAFVYGPDPTRNKGEASIYGVSYEAARKALAEARGVLAEFSEAAARLSDLTLREKATKAAEAIEAMLAGIEEDPDDLRQARKHLKVYLPSLRDAVRKYADAEARGPDAETYLKLRALLTDAAKSYKAKTIALQRDDQIDLEVELEVIGERLRQSGDG